MFQQNTHVVSNPFILDTVVAEKRIPQWEKVWGIKYISPSHLNKFMANKQAWMLDYIFREREYDFLPAALRGQALEFGIMSNMLGKSKEEAYSETITYFFDEVNKYQNNKGEKISPEVYAKEIYKLQAYFNNGLDIIKTMTMASEAKNTDGAIGEIVMKSSKERKINFNIQELDCTVYGEWDFMFKNKDGREVTVDCKTTARLPNEIIRTKENGEPITSRINFTKGKPEHRTQVSVYASALNHDASYIAYIAPQENGTRLAVLNKKEIDENMLNFKKMIASMANVLYHCENAADGDPKRAKELLAKAYPVTSDDMNHYMMRDKEELVAKVLLKHPEWAA